MDGALSGAGLRAGRAGGRAGLVRPGRSWRAGPDGEHDRVRARRLRCSHGPGPAAAVPGLLAALLQPWLSLVYSRLSFSPGFWAFTFSCAAVVADALAWLALKKPPGETGYAIAALALLTGFIAWIAVRTALLAVRGRLFPHPDLA